MTRTKYMKYFLLPAACTLAAAASTPALALNPQPLPPGYYQSYAGAKFAATGRTTTFYGAGGGHRTR
jgi:hypothetical protein